MVFFITSACHQVTKQETIERVFAISISRRFCIHYLETGF